MILDHQKSQQDFDSKKEFFRELFGMGPLNFYPPGN